MPAPEEYTPILWPEEWTRPELLELLKGTPVNCLVIPWTGAGAAGRPVVTEAKRSGFEVFALASDNPAPPGLAALRLQPQEAVQWPADSPVLAFEGGVWPKVASSAAGDSVAAGPTGLPWIESNGWLIQLAKALAPGRTIWMHFDPPQGPEVIRSEAYAVAVCDCEAYGARWLITLDPRLRRGLADGNPEARGVWRQLAAALSTFRKPAMPELRPSALLGALSDFAGGNDTLSREFLNLIARQYTPVRVLVKSATPSASFAGLRLVVYLDPEPLDAVLKDSLMKFVHGGGTLMADAAADPGFGSPREAVPGLDYELRSFGKGRVALGREPFGDPYQAAAGAHVLLGRANDLMRLSNAGSMNASLESSPDGRRARLWIVNYAGQPAASPVTVTLREPYRSARLRRLESPEPASLPVGKEYGRSALYLPPFAVCALLDLEI